MEQQTVSAHQARIETLFGRVDWAVARGVIHVAAIHGPSGRTIAIGPSAPRSPTDRFVLGFARARADVIVTTGSILRSERELVHRYAESAAEERAWSEWRTRVRGRRDRPRLLVLSASGDLPPGHPALEATGGWIWTTREGRARLQPAPAGFSCRVAAEGRGGIADAIADLRARPGVDVVSIEAGPSATASLYAEQTLPPIVDELLLSRFEGDLSKAAEGPPFVPAARLAARFGAPRTSLRRLEPSGPWSFERWLALDGRAAPGDRAEPAAARR